MLRTEVSVESPLLPGSLSLPEVIKLQTNSDDQLEQGHCSQELVAASDGPIITVQPHHTQIADARCPFRQVIKRASDVKNSYVKSVQESEALLEDKHGRQACLLLGL